MGGGADQSKQRGIDGNALVLRFLADSWVESGRMDQIRQESHILSGKSRT